MDAANAARELAGPVRKIVNEPASRPSSAVPLNLTDEHRFYHALQAGRVVRFSIEYEALIGGKWRAVVRADYEKEAKA